MMYATDEQIRQCGNDTEVVKYINQHKLVIVHWQDRLFDTVAPYLLHFSWAHALLS